MYIVSSTGKLAGTGGVIDMFLDKDLGALYILRTRRWRRSRAGCL